MKVFCVIPALNEEEKIGEVVKNVKPLADVVVVVDDGSTDKTGIIATQQGAVVLRHIINSGQGASLQTGNQYSLENGADIIFHFDADGQFSADDIPSMLAPIKSGEAEAVLGSRFLGKKSNMPALKEKVIMPIARKVNKILGVDLTDPQCGFRALNASAWRRITIEQKGMAHSSEILQKIFKNKLKVREVPITVTYHRFGQNFFSGRGIGSGGLRIIKDLFLGKIID